MFVFSNQWVYFIFTATLFYSIKFVITSSQERTTSSYITITLINWATTNWYQISTSPFQVFSFILTSVRNYLHTAEDNFFIYSHYYVFTWATRDWYLFNNSCISSSRSSFSFSISVFSLISLASLSSASILALLELLACCWCSCSSVSRECLDLRAAVRLACTSSN